MKSLRLTGFFRLSLVVAVRRKSYGETCAAFRGLLIRTTREGLIASQAYASIFLRNIVSITRTPNLHAVTFFSDTHSLFTISSLKWHCSSDMADFL